MARQLAQQNETRDECYVQDHVIPITIVVCVAVPFVLVLYVSITLHPMTESIITKVEVICLKTKNILKKLVLWDT